jgi:hypothetical protein
LVQLDPLACPKHNALAGNDIARYSPKAQSDVERVDPERGPEAEFAAVLFHMACGTKRHGVAI